ncbi:hypothetical protein F8271_08480 [Micromonospora sp. ALFpr18c]|uniref:hypothetical protein n=1 Tax=unclassified Micromonospora TaxID=2617518 RepID=UPI00124B8184|nr:hypothetical protein [Micromonospora sp. ALFpr18c]KAB1944947.1 hypothetical protein F8271_08480 [Micromonospora sp. ALFpr18c]
MVRYRRLSLGVAAAVVVLTTGCSSDGATPGAPDVATLETSSAAAPAPSASPTGEAPRFRLDDTESDRAAKMKPYTTCMKSHGVDVMAIRQKKVPAPGDTVTQAANKACDPLYPRQPWEKDPTNPKARDFVYAVVKCLKAKNVDVEPSADGLSYGFAGSADDPGAAGAGLDLAIACERDVAQHATY